MLPSSVWETWDSLVCSRLAAKSRWSWEWLWTLDPLGSTSQVLEFQYERTSMPSLWGARRTLYQLSYNTSPTWYLVKTAGNRARSWNIVTNVCSCGGGWQVKPRSVHFEVHGKEGMGCHKQEVKPDSKRECHALVAQASNNYYCVFE